MALSFRVGTNWCHDFPKLAKASGFSFNTHKSKIRVDWNRISAIDIDRVIRERDFATVDENINNVIDYVLESEYDAKVLDSNFVKLFRLAQLAVEYLLYCKQYLDHSVIILKDELKSKIEEMIKLKKELSASKEVIERLKEKAKDRNNSFDARVGQTNGEIHKCPHCPKTFMSSMFLTAHVMRRHPYVPDMTMVCSPVHERYREETEKLQDEIKTLKERLNRTERVIGNESFRTSDGSKVDNVEKTNKLENVYIVDKNGVFQEQQKKYQAEINSLKSMLFDEIQANHLKQEENSSCTPYNNTTDKGIKSLLSQQETEIQSLRAQLLQKVTLDIESVHSKLHTQENYWKSKIESLECQHRIDMENLIAELRLTQETADHIKNEYESKLDELRRQSVDQSSILIKQRDRLDSLSREISHSEKQRRKSVTSTPKRVDESVKMPQLNSTSWKSASEIPYRIGNTNAVSKTVDSIESNESVEDLRLKTDVACKDFQTIRVESIPDSPLRYRERTVCHETEWQSRKTSDISGNESHSRKRDILLSHEGRHEKKINNQVKSVKMCFNDQSIGKETRTHDASDLRKSTNTFMHSLEKEVESDNDSGNTSRESITQISVMKAKDNIPLDDPGNDMDNSLNTDSESSALDSKSNLDSVSTEENDKDKLLHVPNIEKKIESKTVNWKELQEQLQEAVNKKLFDLGIDPEWPGIPCATFKQKMEIMKHHQHINSKKYPKYNRIKWKTVEEILRRISAKRKEVPNVGMTKSSLDKLMTNVKSKAMRAFNMQKGSNNQKPSIKTNGTPQKRHSLTPRINSLPSDNFKSPEIVKRSPVVRTRDADVDHTRVKQAQNILDRDTYIGQQHSQVEPPHEQPKLKNAFSEAILTSPSQGYSMFYENDHLKREIKTFQSSPRNNKTALKLSTGSVSSLVKKKVLFDLQDTEQESLPRSKSVQKEYENDWDDSSARGQRLQPHEKQKSSSANDIVLKTTQSDKIAEISKKIEEQLSISRHKPVGAIEAMFLSTSMPTDRDNESPLLRGNTSTSWTENIFQKSVVSPEILSKELPQPAPRKLGEKSSQIMNSQIQRSTNEDSDLESDIDEILQVT